MTTEPTPEACCEHGEAIEKLAGELRRANQLLADLVEVRRGKTVRTCDEVHPEYDVHHPGGHPRPEEIQAFAHDSRPNRPRPEQGHIVNTPRFQAALEEFRQKYEQGRLDEL